MDVLRPQVLQVAVGGHVLVVVERDGTSDPAIGRVLTGSWLWDSSLVLAAHLAADSHARRRLLGATVVELGAGGTGLPGIAAVSCLGAARCVLTDVAALLPGLRTNADANGLGAARELRWGDRLQLEDDDERVGVVLLSDVFYDPKDMPAMAATEVDRVTRPLLRGRGQTATFAVYQVLLSLFFSAPPWAHDATSSKTTHETGRGRKSVPY